MGRRGTGRVVQALLLPVELRHNLRFANRKRGSLEVVPLVVISREAGAISSSCDLPPRMPQE